MGGSNSGVNPNNGVQNCGYGQMGGSGIQTPQSIPVLNATVSAPSNFAAPTTGAGKGYAGGATAAKVSWTPTYLRENSVTEVFFAEMPESFAIPDNNDQPKIVNAIVGALKMKSPVALIVNFSNRNIVGVVGMPNTPGVTTSQDSDLYNSVPEKEKNNGFSGGNSALGAYSNGVSAYGGFQGTPVQGQQTEKQGGAPSGSAGN
jgi:hypothetical protein